MRVLALDPGAHETGYVVLEDGRRVREAGVLPNDEMLAYVRRLGTDLHPDKIVNALAVERFEARGMPIGDESIETVLWTGRFIQAWKAPDEVIRVKRSEVKIELCGTTRAKDPNVRQALIDLIGPPGTKKQPGPTYGVTSHAWAALGVAVTASKRACA